jgi:hypothetical protein
VDAVERLLRDEAIEPFEAEGEFAERERTLRGEAARPQAIEVRGQSIRDRR